MSPALRITLDVALPGPAAFDLLVEELTAALSGRGLELTRGPAGGVRQGDLEIARVTEWTDGRHAVLRWHQADWDEAGLIDVVIAVDPAGEASKASVELHGLGEVVGHTGELIGWCAGAAIAPAMRAAAPDAFGDWFTDRHARRPSGAQARTTYADPLYHYPNFGVILEELALTAEDYLIEVGCGGGALLKMALRSGCRAAAIDHSPDMVQLARERNAEAVADERLEVGEAKADALPYADDAFTAAAMTGVLGFLPDPVAALAEIRRVLRPGGRFVGLGSDPELRGTPGAPEPMESRLRFYDDAELEQLARGGGFTNVRVVRRDLEPFAREAGVPEEHLPLFAGESTRFLICRK